MRLLFAQPWWLQFCADTHPCLSIRGPMFGRGEVLASSVATNCSSGARFSARESSHVS